MPSWPGPTFGSRADRRPPSGAARAKARSAGRDIREGIRANLAPSLPFAGCLARPCVTARRHRVHEGEHSLLVLPYAVSHSLSSSSVRSDLAHVITAAVVPNVNGNAVTFR